MRADYTAENSIIGALFLDDGCLETVARIVEPGDFENSTARSAYSAMLWLREQGRQIDPVTVLDCMGGTSDQLAYVSSVMEVAATAAGIEEHCRVLKAQSKRRKLEAIADGIREGAFLGQQWDKLAADAAQEIAALGSEGTRATSGKTAATNWAKHYLQTKSDPEAACCRTGYKRLDAILGGGMFNGEVYILAGRPGMGKTTQGIGIAERVAADGRKVLFVSLEMSTNQITAKRVAMVAGLSYTQVLGGRLAPGEEAEAFSVVATIGDRPFYVADTAATVRDVERYANGIDGLSLIVIDYLGLIRSDMVNEKRYEEMTRISADLKALAKKLNRPILVLAQLNRENTQRSDKRPTMSDLRDSGAIEQDAAGVILLHRESYYKPGEEAPEAEEIELIIAKNRHAAPGTLRMMWHGTTGQITEIDTAHMPF